MAVLGLRFCARAFSSCGERGPLFIAVRGPLTVVASVVAEHRLQTRRLSSCGSRAQLLRSMWDLPGPGLEPVSPVLAGRFSTTAPSGKPYRLGFNGIDAPLYQMSFFSCCFQDFLVVFQEFDYDVSRYGSLNILGSFCPLFFQVFSPAPSLLFSWHSPDMYIGVLDTLLHVSEGHFICLQYSKSPTYE